MALTKHCSNSPLVSHTRLSPNCTKPRNMDIDRISIHCVAGNCSVETIGNIFAPSSRQASSNYGIGTDGRIGMYVEEHNRSWCTSSGANDHRAITIEVSNDSGAPDWHSSDKAVQSLINLCVDIAKRNGKKKLVWMNDKEKTLAYKPKSDEMVLTVHRWFAAKACPGNYLLGKHGYIVETCNKMLAGDKVSTTTPVTIPVTNAPAVAPKETIWKFLSSKGLNDFAVAGIMGNLYAESGLQPNNLQNSFEKKLGHTDASYTAAVDNGTYKNFAKDGAGYGLAQWTYWSRKQGLLDYAKKCKKSIADINVQLEFLWQEMQGYKNMMTKLKNSKSVREASDAFLLDFERPASMNLESTKTKRAGYGQEYYDKYHGKGTPNASKLPYRVRITGNPLNIRKGPGTGYTTNGQIKDNGVYTIVEESTGAGATMWGKLKSGQGWISLDYTKKI